MEFKELIQTIEGRNSLKADFTSAFNLPPVGECETSLLEMYLRLQGLNKKTQTMAKYKYTLKSEDFGIIQVAGSITDISNFTQSEIEAFLKKYPGADFWHKEEIETPTKVKK